MNDIDIKKIINNNSRDIAFIIGNGINLHYNKDNVSWEKLLLYLWQKYSNHGKKTIPKGISFTEFYDALEIQNYRRGDFSSVMQKDVKEKMRFWAPNIDQNLIINRIENLNAPILTTNFDDLIPKSSHLDFRRLEETKFTDYYPWSCYFSNKNLRDPVEGFGIWYPNGLIKYSRSIKLGLSQYMGNVVRARKLIHKEPENISFEGKNQNYWPGYKTWLHIIFNKSLFIFGLGLNESEIFIRWLLIERAKYFKKFPNRKYHGWYITKNKKNDPTFKGKKFFLESVDFKVIEVEDYKTIYQDIWE